MQQCYVTGGAVRDTLLNKSPIDIDYVWTGTTPEYMKSIGYQIVGSSFPVFLDDNGNEHALARIERKVGVGYNGFECVFDPSITIEQDLVRRDLTINSLAVKLEDWKIFQTTKDESLVIDCCGGIRDLNHKLLHHISEAFKEDPIRVLRTARFASRYDFNIHPSTIELMSNVANELNHVPTERIWLEIKKGLSEEFPIIMFDALQQCGALDVNIMTPFCKYNKVGLLKTSKQTPLEIKFALCAIGFKHIDYDNISIPNDCKKISKLFNAHVSDLYRYDTLQPHEKIKLFTNCNAFNNLTNLMLVLDTFNLVWDKTIKSVVLLDINKLNEILIQDIVESCSNGQEIKEKLYKQRLDVLTHYTQ